jgi:hypothetical protein
LKPRRSRAALKAFNWAIVTFQSKLLISYVLHAEKI